MASKFVIKEVLSITFHPIEEDNRPIDKYIRVDDEMKWQQFLDWYSDNVAKYEWHSVAVADRVDINKIGGKERIAGFYITPVGNEYYIRIQECDQWMN